MRLIWRPDFLVLFEFFQRIHVDLNSQAWFLRDSQLSIDEFQVVLNEFLPEF